MKRTNPLKAYPTSWVLMGIHWPKVESDSVKLAELLYGRHFKVVYIGSVLFALQQLLGINAVFIFLHLKMGTPTVELFSHGNCNACLSCVGNLINDWLQRVIFVRWQHANLVWAVVFL
ncbi:hypothetical protein MLD38_014349 [Melastoma candidum]|uniref:Uncharacterized protein n=1 Tax=Melastoma candidum TaxID=119954 RepID=A0ACB9RDT5_9MYRT|nr:hypothetical protein MLD38_014349 [Melastoma candidum]